MSKSINKTLLRKIRNKEILELANQGITYEEIGKKFGLTRSRISQICIENRVVQRPSDININTWKNIWNKHEKDECCKDCA